MTRETEIGIKTDRLCAMMAEQRVGGVILSGQHNFAWLSGGGSNAVNIAADAGIASLFVRSDGKRFLLANRIESARLAEEELPPDSFEPITFDWQTEKADPGHAAALAAKLISDGNELISDIPVAGARAAEPMIAPLRYSLTAAEAERYRNLGKDVSDAIEKAFGRIAPGMQERSIAAVVTECLLAFDIFPQVLLVAAGDRAIRFRHPVPTANTWNFGTLMIVVCGRRHGLIANLSRLAHRGPAPAELVARNVAARGILSAACEATRPGATGGDLYSLLENEYRRHGFANEIDLHHQGGATGYKTREWVAFPECRMRVEESQAFAWNPSITGTKAEETIVVGAEANEFVTVCEPDPIRIY